MNFNILIPCTPQNDNDLYAFVNGLLNNPVPEGLGFDDRTVIDLIDLFFSQYSNTVFALVKTMETPA